MDLNIQLIPYKNKSSDILKYHIINSSDKNIIYKICNIYAPFGRQINNNHTSQHRLNIGFTRKQIIDEDKIYHELEHLIHEIETYFGKFDELKNYELISSIIDRKELGCVIRLHLKIFKNKTTTPLVQMINGQDENVEWIQFDKNKQINIDLHPECLWIDNNNKKYGIYFMIDKVFQFIS